MKIIQGLTDAPNQQLNLLLPDGSRVTLIMYFRPQQLGWFYDVQWTKVDGTQFSIRGNRLVSSPNMLRQFRKRIPFGLGAVTLRNIEPVTQTIFVDGTATLILLDAVDIANIETKVYPGL